MIIFKIGGVVVKCKDDFLNLISFLEKLDDSHQKFIVLSAFYKTSSFLKELSQVAVYNRQKALKILADIIFFHRSLINEQKNEKELQEFLSTTEESLSLLIKGLSLTKKLTPSILDKILHFGEEMAIHLISKSLNFQHDVMQAKEIIITDSRFNNANPLIEQTKEKVIASLSKIKSNCILTQGFLGADKDKKPTTMGFESSNLTACIIAEVLGVTSITIITDVDGIYETDPKIQSSAHLEYISYEQAEYLSAMGLKLLYPKMILLAKTHKINISFTNISGNQHTYISEKDSNFKNIILNDEVLCVAGNIDKAEFTFSDLKQECSFIKEHNNVSNSNKVLDYTLFSFYGLGYKEMNTLNNHQNDIIHFENNLNKVSRYVIKSQSQDLFLQTALSLL